MAVYYLGTNIPGNTLMTQFQLSEIYTDAGLSSDLREVVIRMVMDHGLLERSHDKIYEPEVSGDLILATQDARSAFVTVYETDRPNDQLMVFADERNQDMVDFWISQRMKQSTGFSFKVNFRNPSLRKHFPPNNANFAPGYKPMQQPAETHVSLDLPDLNTKGFSKPDVTRRHLP